jgi:hypothetical protein
MFFAHRIPGLVSTMVSDDEIADNNKSFAEALKMIASDKPEELTDKHKELQALLKAFLSKDLIRLPDDASVQKGTLLHKGTSLDNSMTL